MDQRDAELGADQGQVLGAIVGAIIDIQPGRPTPTQEGLLEDRQELSSVND